MAESDESGKSALPLPELNPLLNPTLSKNMSRWAEVYFNSPPENREGAVRELLRELEGGASSKGATAPPSTAMSADQAESSQAAVQVQTFTCQSCGFLTRPNQKFCGRCGSRLVSAVAPENGQGRSHWGSTMPIPSAGGHAATPEPSHSFTGKSSAEPEPPASLWSAQREEERNPVWYSYRHYIGAGLAVVVLIVAFMAWQGTKTSPGSSRRNEQTPATTSITPAAPKSANSAESGTGNSPVAVSPPPPASTMQPSAPVRQQPVKPPAQHQAPLTTDNQLPNAQAPQYGTGAEELATARQFLDASNSNEAAVWLWKAVEKKNTEALVALAHLYLRGDGVPKNCEQARVLLDAAARKDSASAATLLQNLQTYGCQ